MPPRWRPAQRARGSAARTPPQCRRASRAPPYRLRALERSSRPPLPPTALEMACGTRCSRAPPRATLPRRCCCCCRCRWPSGTRRQSGRPWRQSPDTATPPSARRYRGSRPVKPSPVHSCSPARPRSTCFGRERSACLSPRSLARERARIARETTAAETPQWRWRWRRRLHPTQQYSRAYDGGHRRDGAQRQRVRFVRVGTYQ